MASSRIQRLTERYRASPAKERTTEEDFLVDTRIGLTELGGPEEPLIDFVFVHGLRGGSFKTWRKYEDPSSLWPKSWLPAHPDFAGVRTSTFGYQSDFLSRQGHRLDVAEFGRKLSNELQISSFLRRSGHTPIVLIGHSMGGLVIKKAYLLARHEKPELASRIKSIVFLATPHRGSDWAVLLNGILAMTLNAKEYVKNLLKDSASLSWINDDFRHYANDVGLWTFHEEEQMVNGLPCDVVVHKQSAILGLKHEHVFPVSANHRDICKFDSPDDPNYITLRNALATIVDELVGHGIETHVVTKGDEMESISSLINVFDAPIEDLDEQDRLKTPGTCQWLERKASFLRWLRIAERQDASQRSDATQASKGLLTSSQEANCRIFWLTAQPGAGKSVCSAHVVNLLQEKGHDCCYFFFQHGGKHRTLLSSMLRSIAFQMAGLHAEVRALLQKVSPAAFNSDRDDEVTVWKHLFIGSIFKAHLKRPQFWVLDALDECSGATKIFSLLTKLASTFQLRIFVTSRPTPEFERGFSKLGSRYNVIMDSILPADTNEDMKIYLSSNASWLDVNEEDEGGIFDRLLLRSNGCFLWTKLVRQELESVYSLESVESVLDEIPSGMWALYERSLAQMALQTREKRLAQAILTFSVCAVRPLKLSELQTALKTDANFHIRDLRLSIEGLCGSLLYVDQNDHVQLVHSTLRDFLFSEDVHSDYSLKQSEGHERLAKTCLKYMETEMRPPRSRSFGRSLEMRAEETPIFAQYAALAFSEHVAASSSTSDSLLIAIAKFLRSSVLAWVEHVASQEPSLYWLTRTAKNFIRYLERRAKHVSPLGDEFKLVQDWATDLIRLVAKFGRNLREQPSSIFFLIPSIAPKDSRLYECSRNNPAWLKMYGSATDMWDDCLSFIEYRDTYATALACGESCFAIGMKNGSITVYDHSTCQERIGVTHHSQADANTKQANVVKLLAFGSSDEMLASCGVNSICVWSSAGDLLHMFALNEPHIATTFSLDSESVIAVTNSSRVNRFELKRVESELIPPAGLYRRRSSGYYEAEGLQLPRQAPLAVAMSPDQMTLALLYRGKPIYLYSLEDGLVRGTCGRDANSTAPDISVLTALFHPISEVDILAVSHQDGDLALFDTWTHKKLKSVDADAYTLAASPSGQFLGTGNTGGTLRIWTFETLELLYVIKSGFEEVRGLAFTGDGMRLIDRRDSRVKVWEPSALVRQSSGEEDSASLSDATALTAPEVGDNEEEVTTTALTTDCHGLSIFAGRSDGSVAIYDSKSGSLVTTISPDTGNDFIVALAAGEDILAVANSSQAVSAFKLPRNRTSTIKCDVVLKCTVEEPVQQLALFPSGERVLIVTCESDTLWNLSTGQVVKKLSHERSTAVSSGRWLSMGPHIAALSLGKELRLYDWSSLEERQSVNLTVPTIQGQRNPQSIDVESVALTASSRYLVAVLTPQTATQFQTHIVAWNNPFHSDVSGKLSAPLTVDLDIPPGNVRYFLGVHQEKIVFVNHDLWICSFDLADIGRPMKSGIRKHIFVPSDLVGSVTEAKPIITPQGLLVFSKAGNLAIIQGALDWNFR